MGWVLRVGPADWSLDWTAVCCDHFMTRPPVVTAGQRRNFDMLELEHNISIAMDMASYFAKACEGARNHTHRDARSTRHKPCALCDLCTCAAIAQVVFLARLSTHTRTGVHGSSRSLRTIGTQ